MSDVPSNDMPVTPPPPIWAVIRRNPVALKELRGRMRGPRAFIVLTAYVFLMSLFTVVLYWIYTASSTITLSTTGGVIGKLIFGGVLVVELFLVCFIAPAFTSAAISGERERRTYQLLRTTLLSARRLVWGKMFAAMAYVMLLLLVAVPLQSLAFLMGGVTFAEVLLSIELLIVTAFTYSAAGIYFSASTKRTLSASVLTYVVALMLTIALPLIALVFFGFISAWSAVGAFDQPITELVLLVVFGLLACTNPIATAILTEVVLQQYSSAFFFTMTLTNGTSLPLISPWIIFTVIFVVIGLGFIEMSVRAVRKVET